MTRWKDERKPMTGVGRCESGERCGLAAAGGDSPQRIVRSWRKDNLTVVGPRTAATGRRVAHGDRRPRRRVDALQLAFGEEPDGSAVRRPERKRRIVGAGNRAPYVAVEWPHGQRVFAARVGHDRDDSPRIG